MFNRCRIQKEADGCRQAPRHRRSRVKIALPLLLLCPLAHGAVCPTGQLKDQATLVRAEHLWLQAAEQHYVAALECILANEFEEADFAVSLIDRLAMLCIVANPGSGHTELLDLHFFFSSRRRHTRFSRPA